MHKPVNFELGSSKIEGIENKRGTGIVGGGRPNDGKDGRQTFLKTG